MSKKLREELKQKGDECCQLQTELLFSKQNLVLNIFISFMQSLHAVGKGRRLLYFQERKYLMGKLENAEEKLFKVFV